MARSSRSSSKHARPSIPLLLLRSREIGAAQFKARCLELMDEVERSGMEIVITKHRNPVARLVPVDAGIGGFCGSLKRMVLKAGDLVSPIDVERGAAVLPVGTV